jgi:hypothetical protein
MFPLVKPQVPETPGLRQLQDRSEEDLAAEIETAEQFLQTAETYLAWARMGAQLVSQLKALQGNLSTSLGKIGEQADAMVSLAAAAKTTRNIGTHAGRPSLRRAVLMVMSTEPERIWRKRDIMQALRDTGWESRALKPSAQLATRLSEMVERGQLVRIEHGHYALPSSVAAKSAPVEGDESATAKVGADR